MASKVDALITLTDNLADRLSWQSGLEFELTMIKGAVINIPTDDNEGAEIAMSFLGAAIKSFASMSIDDDLVESLKSGLSYLYKENVRRKQKAKFEIYLLLQTRKWAIIDDIFWSKKKNNSS